MKIAPFVIAALCLFAALPVGCRYYESPNRAFANHDHNLYGGEWVPRMFPTDVTDIHEQHNIDTNDVWLRFTKGSELFVPTKHGYAAVPSTEAASLAVRRPLLVGWWFDDIEPADAVYRGTCHSGTGFVLERGAQVYWWCQSEA